MLTIEEVQTKFIKAHQIDFNVLCNELERGFILSQGDLTYYLKNPSEYINVYKACINKALLVELTDKNCYESFEKRLKTKRKLVAKITETQLEQILKVEKFVKEQGVEYKRALIKFLTT